MQYTVKPKESASAQYLVVGSLVKSYNDNIYVISSNTLQSNILSKLLKYALCLETYQAVLLVKSQVAQL